MMVIISLFLVKAVSANPNVNWYVGTFKSDLWAASQQFIRTLEVTPETPTDRQNIASIFPSSNPSRENNAVITPTFPLGWYSSVDYPDALGQMTTEAINFVVPYTGQERC